MLVSKTIIKKEAKSKYFTPNLYDYKKVKESFVWKNAEAELDWLAGRKINASYNAVERNAKNYRKNKVALYWEGETGEQKKLTFWELNELSNKFANILSGLGVTRGDRVFFYLPRVPELFYGFLGTLKTGAIGGTLFAAFGSQGVYDRLFSSSAKILVTNKELGQRVDKIRKKLPELKKIVVIDEKKSRGDVVSLEERLSKSSSEYKCAKMEADEAAFMLYTSGTTGKPKGVVHVHKAILLQHMTAKWVLDLRDDDIYWCTADPGWVTGIAYEILGSLSNGASTLIYEGRFDPEKWYWLLDKYNINVWYTAPTAIRMLQAAGDGLIKKFNLSPLRHLCSVGEPLNPEAVWWGKRVFGLPFHDNWWQTETGGILIANYRSMDIKPGSMGKPIPGVAAGIVDDQGKEVKTGVEGNLAIRPGWPSMMKKIWRRPKKYKSYFKNDWYFSGDRAYVDEDGYYWFVGRADDVIKTAGERVGPFEVESTLVEHRAVAEAGVIGKPDQLRGEIIKAFVTLNKGYLGGEKLVIELQNYVKKNLGGHAYPREIEFVESLPKTRSGKIMRRLLKAKELDLPVGDTSTLEEY
jgi:acetyl-CoA synthetase